MMTPDGGPSTWPSHHHPCTSCLTQSISHRRTRRSRTASRAASATTAHGCSSHTDRVEAEEVKVTKVSHMVWVSHEALLCYGHVCDEQCPPIVVSPPLSRRTRIKYAARRIRW